ncbi:MAG: ATP-binding protein, partial [Deltaproteobacteria bacterium]|nr:ATP-binding protein [Deltaproteobacteria bacterium]
LRLHGFDRNKKQILYFDEAQESELLGSYLRFIKEDLVNTTCITTGSSMTRLFRPDQRVPVGRYLSLRLGPFSFDEFLQTAQQDALIEAVRSPVNKLTDIGQALHQNLLGELDSYLSTGGMPEVVLQFRNGADYKRTLKSLLLSQEEDFVRKSGFVNRRQFMDVLKGVSNFLGYTSKYTHMSDEVREIKKVATLMQAWHLIHEVEQKCLSSTTSFYPKRYCYDLGIAQMVRNMPFPTLSILKTLDEGLRTQLGGLLENMVLIQLKEFQLGQCDISGFKNGSNGNAEVDFIVFSRTIVPIECKASQKITPRSFSSLRQYLQKSKTRIGFLVSAAPYKKYKEGGMVFYNIPLYLCRYEIFDAMVRQAHDAL